MTADELPPLGPGQHGHARSPGRRKRPARRKRSSRSPPSGRPADAASGERLDDLAARYYGDPRLWRLLAAVNNVDDPLRIPPGLVLRIPPRSAIRGSHVIGVATLPSLSVESEGAPLPGALLAALTDVRVQQRLSLPTQCELTFAAPLDTLPAALAPGQTLRLRTEAADVAALRRRDHRARIQLRGGSRRGHPCPRLRPAPPPPQAPDAYACTCR